MGVYPDFAPLLIAPRKMADQEKTENTEALISSSSSFTPSQRIYLTYLLGYLTLASSLTANIYFPLIEALSHQYRASIQAINLTITVYVVFQAISPAFFAPMSDTLGRRPVFLLTLSAVLRALALPLTSIAIHCFFY